MEQIRFTATKIAAGKKGILRPDDQGYYTTVVGGLNVYNSRGEYYVAEGAKQLFEQSSIFMRRVANGCVKAEMGHPKRLPGMSTDDYLARLMTIEETNVCAFFSEFWLDFDFGKQHPEFNNPDLIAIMAKVKPCGPFGHTLQKSFESEGENVCFSIRALTRDYYQKGKTYRVLESIMCFDNIVEPGLTLATKFNSPVLESIEDCVIRLTSLEKLAKSAVLSTATEDSRAFAIEAYARLSSKTKLSVTEVPAITNW